jgi:hypothetical protein
VGYLQVGPQYYPPRVNGAQIISRGPHGAALAEGPQRRPDGSFRWWAEQMQDAGAYKGYWQPQQQVVGVMGLGNFVTDWLADKLADSGLVDARGGNTSGRAFDPSVNKTAGAASPFSKATLTQAVRAVVMESRRGRYTNAQLRGSIEQVRASLMNAGRWTDSGTAPNGQAYVPSPTLMEELASAQNLLIQASGTREDGAPMIAPGAIDPNTGRVRLDDPREAARRELRRSLPEAFAPVSPASMLNKALLIGAVGLVLYGAAQGIGFAFASRRRK